MVLEMTSFATVVVSGNKSGKKRPDSFVSVSSL
jgi:hypothetical protein